MMNSTCLAKSKESNNLNFLSVTVKDRKFISKSFRKRIIKNVRNRKEAKKKKRGLEVLFARSERRESASQGLFYYDAFNEL